MNTLLGRATAIFAVLAIVAIATSIIMGLYVRKNREARDTAYSGAVAAAARKENEEWKKEKAALEAEAREHPGAIAQMPLMKGTALAAAKAVNDEFDPTYFRLVRYQTVTDGAAIGFAALALFGATVRELLRRKGSPFR